MANNLASNLSYNKSLSPTVGILLTASSADPEKKTRPLAVTHVQGRGGVSNYLPGVEMGEYKNGAAAAEDNDDDEENVESSKKKAQTPDAPNLYEGDTCFMPFDDDLLILKFNMLAEAQTKTPQMCNTPELRERLEQVVSQYAELDGFNELGRRYLWNILNGRPLWRNLTRNFGLVVEVTDLADRSVLRYDTTNGDKALSLTKCDLPNTKPIGAFVKKIGDALAGKSAPMRIGVNITATMLPGSEVFPSQGFAENADGGKLLAKDRFGNAQMHPQKIGAALRFVDDWYPAATRTIAAEPFGFDQGVLENFRLKKSGSDKEVGVNFYQLLFRADTNLLAPLMKAKPGSAISNDIHYFIAVLIRGGVFANVKSKK